MTSGELADKLADIVAHVFHPLFITWFLGFLFLYLADLGMETSLRWVLVFGGITVVPIGLFLYFHPTYTIRARNGKEKRNLLYLIGFLELVVVGIVLYRFNGPEILKTGYAGAMATLILGGLLNWRYTKASVHVGVMSGFATATFFVSPTVGIGLFSLVGLVAWARVQANKHTLIQVVLGALTPLVCISAAYLFI